MDKDEKIAAVKAKLTGWIEGMKGQYDHVSNDKGMGVDIADYFPGETDPYGSFVYKMYKDRLEIASPRSPRYSLLNTKADIRTIQYEQLTDKDADMMYAEFIKI